MKKGFLTVIFTLLLLGFSSQAQKIALVLSGGGSRGVAHIGVLKALEENHIPIDYIAGTSMGAVIGGLYASGYSPAQIEEFIASEEFEKWARGEVEDKYIYYFKKPDPNASWIDLKFDFDDISGKLKTRLPTNLISPYQMDFAILEMYASASAVSGYNFDSLFVPFRCVASDIDSNQFIVLGKGQLGTAVRASATYPFYFKPIKIDGKLLFDGGIYNNFPVDVAMETFHPDIVIGSIATSNPASPKEYDLLSHIVNMIVNETDFTVPEGNGVLIATDVPSINIIDFSQSRAIIDSGYHATTAVVGRIQELLKGRSATDVSERRYEFNQEKPPVIIDSIRIRGLNKSQSYYVRKLLQKRSEYVNLESLKSEYFKLLADNKIKEVFPTLIFNPDRGFYTLDLNIQRAEHFMTEFGGNISSSAANAGYVGLEYRILYKIGVNIAANGYFGRFYSSANMEIRIDFPSSFPFYVSADYTYNHKDYFKNSTYFFEDKTPTFLIQNENHFGLNIGIPSTNRGRAFAGIYSGYTLDEYYQDNNFTRSDTADRTRFNFSTVNMTFELNSQNYKQLATAGTFLHLSLRYIQGEETTTPGTTSQQESIVVDQPHDWFQFRFVYDNYFKTIKWLKIGFYGELQLSNMPVFSNYTAAILRAPAFSPIPEMKTLFLPKYRAPNYAAAGLKLLFNPYKQFFIRTEGYLFQPYEEIVPGENQEALYRQPFTDRSFVGSAGVEYHSPIGPISLAFTYYDRAEDNLSILFNIGYILFNRSAFE
jgi:NTE family protein